MRKPDILVLFLIGIFCSGTHSQVHGPVFRANQGTPVRQNQVNKNWGPQQQQNNWPQNTWQGRGQQSWANNPQQQPTWGTNQIQANPNTQQNWNVNPQSGWNQNPPQQNWNTNPTGSGPQQAMVAGPTGQQSNWQAPPGRGTNPNNQNTHWAQSQQGQNTVKQGEWQPGMNTMGRPVNTGGQTQDTKIGIPVSQQNTNWAVTTNRQTPAGQQTGPTQHPLGTPKSGPTGQWVEINTGAPELGKVQPSQTAVNPAPGLPVAANPAPGLPVTTPIYQRTGMPPRQPQRRNWPARRTPRPRPTTPKPTTTTLSIWDLIYTTPFPGNKPGTCPNAATARRECTKHCRRDQDCLDIRKCCHSNFFNGTGCCTVVDAPTDWMMGFFMNPAMGFFKK